MNKSFVLVIVCITVILSMTVIFNRSKTPMASGTTALAAPAATLNAADCDGTGNISCISVLNIGQGNCVVVSCPNNKGFVLADCGTVSKKDGQMDLAAKTVTDYLTAIGRIDGPKASQTKAFINTIVLSHSDEDHYNLLPLVFNEKNAANLTETILYSGRMADYKANGFQDWLSDVQRPGVTVKGVAIDRHDTAIAADLSCNDGTNGFQILQANFSGAKPKRIPNDWSIVMQYHHKGNTVLLPGDAGVDVEHSIMNVYIAAQLETNVLVASHHGASTNTNDPLWVSKIRPQIMLFSARKGSPYFHPRCKTRLDYIGDKDQRLKDKYATHDIKCWERTALWTEEDELDEGDSNYDYYESDNAAFEDRDLHIDDGIFATLKSGDVTTPNTWVYSSYVVRIDPSDTSGNISVWDCPSDGVGNPGGFKFSTCQLINKK